MVRMTQGVGQVKFLDGHMKRQHVFIKNIVTVCQILQTTILGINGKENRKYIARLKNKFSPGKVAAIADRSTTGPVE